MPRLLQDFASEQSADNMANQYKSKKPRQNPLTPGQTNSGQDSMLAPPPQADSAPGANVEGLATGQKGQAALSSSGLLSGKVTPLDLVATKTADNMAGKAQAPSETLSADAGQLVQNAAMPNQMRSAPGQTGQQGMQGTGNTITQQTGQQQGTQGGSAGPVEQKEAEPNAAIQSGMADAYKRQTERQAEWDAAEAKRRQAAKEALGEGSFDTGSAGGLNTTEDATKKYWENERQKAIEALGEGSFDTGGSGGYNTTEDATRQYWENERIPDMKPVGGEELSAEAKAKAEAEKLHAAQVEGMSPAQAAIWDKLYGGNTMSEQERKSLGAGALADKNRTKEIIDRMAGAAGGTSAGQIIGTAANEFGYGQALGDIEKQKYNREASQLNQAQGLAESAAARQERIAAGTDRTFNDAAAYFNEKGYTLTADGRILDGEGREIPAIDLPPEERQRYEQWQSDSGGQTAVDQEAIRMAKINQGTKARHDANKKDIMDKGVEDTDIANAYAAAIENDEIKTDEEKEQWLLNHGYVWSDTMKKWVKSKAINEGKT